MPSTATITAFYSFSANTKARANYVNTNFSNFRGHIIAIDPNTATAATTETYDLGSTEYRWRTGYFRSIDFRSNTTTAGTTKIVGDTGGALDVFIAGVTLGSFKTDGFTRGGIKKSELFSSVALTSSFYSISLTSTKIFELSITSNGHMALVGLNFIYNTLNRPLYLAGGSSVDKYGKIAIYRDGTAPGDVVFNRRYYTSARPTTTSISVGEGIADARFYDISLTPGGHTYYVYLEAEAGSSIEGNENTDKFCFLELI